jgi:hypothetical protein
MVSKQQSLGAASSKPSSRDHHEPPCGNRRVFGRVKRLHHRCDRKDRPGSEPSGAKIPIKRWQEQPALLEFLRSLYADCYVAFEIANLVRPPTGGVGRHINCGATFDAGIRHVRICGGRGGQPPRLPGDHELCKPVNEMVLDSRTGEEEAGNGAVLAEPRHRFRVDARSLYEPARMGQRASTV